ncbi:hypothetical protein GCL60_10315 [Silvanigrella paludirubra]|uniref:Type I restriction modification DNA specificity domain-containing protein n=1 Tax=Silvanigrella paludirubra TaxID=2499159 RepID=A0A6N6VQE1_9BACT|nr:restriction endonuclease subunit S [Silvanigrella paludirubra]KAB8037562.1 hypothetical protein GCL60_10315 [Silvanigrella paludirubra]
MELKEGFKKTEIGFIPVDWKTENLRENLLGIPKYGINASAVTFDSRLPTYLRITDITDEGRINPDSLASVNHRAANEYRLEEYDVVFARTGASVGKSYLYQKKDGEFVYAGFLIRVQTDHHKLYAPYLFQFSKSAQYWKWIREHSMRSGQPGVNGKQYSELQIPLPPSIKEQKVIANALSDADSYIESLEKLIAKKQLIKKGVMQELLTGKRRLDGCYHSWSKKTLGEISEIIMGQSPLSSFYNTFGNGLPLIQGNSDIINRKPIQRVFTTNVTKKGEPGDILISVRAPVGTVAKASFDCCLGRGICALRNAGDFLYYALEAKESHWSSLSKGSTFDSVTSLELKNFLIHYPNDEIERNLISQVIINIDEDIRGTEKALTKARQIKQGMMQQLLTGRIRLV